MLWDSGQVRALEGKDELRIQIMFCILITEHGYTLFLLFQTDMAFNGT